MLLKIVLDKSRIPGSVPIPSPKEIGVMFLAALHRAGVERRIINNVENFFIRATPSYRIPDHTITNEGIDLSENVFYVYYATKITGTNLNAFQSVIADLDSLMGVRASYKIVDEDIELNCFAWKYGYDVEMFTRSQSYLYNEPLPVDRKTKRLPTRIVLDMSVPIPEADALSLTNLLHKYLVSSLPYNHQLRGRYMLDPLSDDDSIYYDYHLNSDSKITKLSLESVNGLTNELTMFLEHGIHTVKHSDTKIALTHRSTDFYSVGKHLHYKTIKPMFMMGQSDKSGLRYTPEANVLSSIESTIHYNDYQKLDFYREGDYICADLRDLGKVSVKASPLQTDVIGVRGYRRGQGSNGDGFSAEIKLETPYSLRAVGMHRRFGAGVLEPVDAP